MLPLVFPLLFNKLMLSLLLHPLLGLCLWVSRLRAINGLESPMNGARSRENTTSF